MADYQNLFTTVQVAGPVHHGVELHDSLSPRTGKPFLLHLAGRLGNAQIGPIYLGGLGIMSEHAGLGELGSDSIYSSVVLAGTGATGTG